MQRKNSHAHSHHFSLSSAGRWLFVQRVAADLQAVPDFQLIKRTLRTRYLAQAQAAAGAVLGLEESTTSPGISRYERGNRMPDNESMAKLAETLEHPVAYFHAVSEPMAEAILVMAQLPEEAQEERVHRMREFAKVECANQGGTGVDLAICRLVLSKSDR
jgi:transcriptional regulator with XRE-family HTH domain